MGDLVLEYIIQELPVCLVCRLAGVALLSCELSSAEIERDERGWGCSWAFICLEIEAIFYNYLILAIHEG